MLHALEGLDPLARNLIVASRRFARQQMPRIDAGDGSWLRPSEAMMLMAVSHGSGKPSALASRMGISAGAVAQVLSALERRGLIIRSTAPDDRRSVRVDLTPEGASVVRIATGSMAAAFSGLVRELGSDEAARLTGLLERSADYFAALRGAGSREEESGCAH